MGITRNNRHKRRATGGKKKHYRKDRKFEMGRQPTNTKMGERKTSLVRMRGGKMKVRAIRLDAGNFSWATEGMGRKSRILGVSYNATSNELVRTNTLVKNAIIQIDATPFRLWYEQRYGIKLVNKKKAVIGKKPVKPTAAGAKKVAKPAAGAKKGAKPAAGAKKGAVAKKTATTTAGEKEVKTEEKKASVKKAEKRPRKEGGYAKPRPKDLGKRLVPSPDFPYTRRTHTKAAAVVAAALLKRYKLSHRKRAELVEKAHRMHRAEKREERKFQKAKAAYLKAKAEGKAPAEFPYEVEKQKAQRLANHFIAKRQALRRKKHPTKSVDKHLLEQFQTGRLYACIASRPGQDGCADGYILEGKELEFYLKKMKK